MIFDWQFGLSEWLAKRILLPFILIKKEILILITNFFSRIAAVVSVQIKEKRTLELVVQLAPAVGLLLADNLATVFRDEFALLNGVLR